jgi:hypothetical protein
MLTVPREEDRMNMVVARILRHRRWWLLGLGVLAVAWALLAWHRGATADRLTPSFTGNSSQLPYTVIVPTLDTPMPTGKNVLWCSAMQLAWHRLRDEVVKAPVQLTDAEEVATRLNRAPQSAADLPEGSYYAAAGLVQQGIIDEIQRAMRAQFPDEPTPEFGTVAPEDILAFAFLKAEARFTTPFPRPRERLTFTDSSRNQTEITAFGVLHADHMRGDDPRRDVEVLYSSGGADDAELVIDPCNTSTPNQLLLARVTPQPSLAATVARVEALMQRDQGSPFVDEVLIPNMYWRIEHDYRELLRKSLANPGFDDYIITHAHQSFDFRLDRKGARIVSKVDLRGYASKPLPPCHFDRPFLLIMKQRGAKHPFFVMWVDNAELLQQYGL